MTSDLSAHRRDEVLQAARLAIAPDRIELQLDVTPGIELGGAVIAGIDRDGDGALSAAEKSAYVSAIVSSLALGVDGIPVGVPSPSVEFPDVERLRSGDGTIRLTSTIELPGLGDGAHNVSFTNDHHPDSSVYLANALAPSDHQISIHRQRRDADQRSLTIDFTVARERSAALPVWLFGSAALAWCMVRLRR